MTEQPKKDIRIQIDASPQMKEKDEKISELNQKLGEASGRLFEKERDEICKQAGINPQLITDPVELPLIKRLAEQKRLENPKQAEHGETASLLNEPSYRETHHVQTFHLDEESQVLDMNPKFPSTEEAMNYIKKSASNPQSGDYRLANQLYGKLVSKALKQGGTYEFCGNMAKWERHGEEVVKATRPKTFKRVDD